MLKGTLPLWGQAGHDTAPATQAGPRQRAAASALRALTACALLAPSLALAAPRRRL